ncbi:hypothetical protein V1477_010559 [Vespula maculifrons]|uniref:Uncharacterized protein n=1 Tax=Vespula maculifrons TaxID=7453 RepID=A0ABD2C2B4_VESMC
MACYFLSLPLRKYLWIRHDVCFRSWYLLGDYRAGIATEQGKGRRRRDKEKKNTPDTLRGSDRFLILANDWREARSDCVESVLNPRKKKTMSPTTTITLPLLVDRGSSDGRSFRKR